MMKVYSNRWKMVGLLMLLATSFSLRAQDKEWASWTTVGIDYRLNNKWDIASGVEWRTKDNFTKTDRWAIDVGATYKLLPFLKMGAGYELHYRNRGDEGWKLRHRYYLDGTLSTKVQRIKLSLRERIQHTFQAHSDEFRLRSRFKMAYDAPRCEVEPYLSVEMYNGLNVGDRFGVTRMRYRGGIALPISQRWTADLFYCRQWEENGRKNVFGIEAVYEF